MEEIGMLSNRAPNSAALETESDDSNDCCENDKEQGEQLQVVVASRVVNRPHIIDKVEADKVPELCILLTNWPF